MRAVWRAARAAVRRRRLQTLVIALMVAISTTLLTFAAGLLAASTGPFDHAFKVRNGAHVAATFDIGKVTPDRLAATTDTAGVLAAAGPFPVAKVATTSVFNELLVVGRPGPDSPVDDLKMVEGRWADRPGEVVISSKWKGRPLPYEISTRQGATLTVVGSASSVSRTATAWAAPAVVASLGKPAGLQMLYRFDAASTPAKVKADLDKVTRPLPGDVLLGSSSWLDARKDATEGPKSILSFIALFGLLGLLTAVLIIANVVSGAVVAGFRHIGVLKALGFTPAQVTGVYVTMVIVPAVAGCLAGAVLGNRLTALLLSQVEDVLELPSVAGSGLVYDLIAVTVVLGVVVATALVPAARAGRLPAAHAIAAHAISSEGRARRAQTWLSGLSLPRPLTLGLALPLARPGRAALTIAAVAFGVMSVTFASGLDGSIRGLREAQSERSTVIQATAKNPSPEFTGRVEALIRSRPGVAAVLRGARVEVSITGLTGEFEAEGVQRGGTTRGVMLDGRWFTGPGEVVVADTFLRTHDRRIGDTLRLRTGGGTAMVKIVGTTFETGGETTVLTDLTTLTALDPAVRLDRFLVDLTPGTDSIAFTRGLVPAMDADPVLRAADHDLNVQTSGGNDEDIIFTVLFGSLALLISIACALGVLNTVVLNTRERSRDLGILKAVGMTPPQVVVMMVVSMTAIGLIGGLIGVPAGVGLHRLALNTTSESMGSALPESMYDPFTVLLLVALPAAGVLIAALGALLPAGWAAKIKTAAVLRGE